MSHDDDVGVGATDPIQSMPTLMSKKLRRKRPLLWKFASRHGSIVNGIADDEVNDFNVEVVDCSSHEVDFKDATNTSIEPLARAAVTVPSSLQQRPPLPPRIPSSSWATRSGSNGRQRRPPPIPEDVPGRKKSTTPYPRSSPPTSTTTMQSSSPNTESNQKYNDDNIKDEEGIDGFRIGQLQKQQKQQHLSPHHQYQSSPSQLESSLSDIDVDFNSDIMNEATSAAIELIQTKQIQQHQQQLQETIDRLEANLTIEDEGTNEEEAKEEEEEKEKEETYDQNIDELCSSDNTQHQPLQEDYKFEAVEVRILKERYKVAAAASAAAARGASSSTTTPALVNKQKTPQAKKKKTRKMNSNVKRQYFVSDRSKNAILERAKQIVEEAKTIKDHSNKDTSNFSSSPKKSSRSNDSPRRIATTTTTTRRTTTTTATSDSKIPTATSSSNRFHQQRPQVARIITPTTTTTGNRSRRRDDQLQLMRKYNKKRLMRQKKKEMLASNLDVIVETVTESDNDNSDNEGDSYTYEEEKSLSSNNDHNDSNGGNDTYDEESNSNLNSNKEKDEDEATISFSSGSSGRSSLQDEYDAIDKELADSTVSLSSGSSASSLHNEEDDNDYENEQPFDEYHRENSELDFAVEGSGDSSIMDVDFNRDTDTSESTEELPFDERLDRTVDLVTTTVKEMELVDDEHNDSLRLTTATGHEEEKKMDDYDFSSSASQSGYSKEQQHQDNSEIDILIQQQMHQSENQQQRQDYSRVENEYINSILQPEYSEQSKDHDLDTSVLVREYHEIQRHQYKQRQDYNHDSISSLDLQQHQDSDKPILEREDHEIQQHQDYLQSHNISNQNNNKFSYANSNAHNSDKHVSFNKKISSAAHDTVGTTSGRMKLMVASKVRQMNNNSYNRRIGGGGEVTLNHGRRFVNNNIHSARIPTIQPILRKKHDDNTSLSTTQQGIGQNDQSTHDVDYNHSPETSPKRWPVFSSYTPSSESHSKNSPNKQHNDIPAMAYSPSGSSNSTSDKANDGETGGVITNLSNISIMNKRDSTRKKKKKKKKKKEKQHSAKPNSIQSRISLFENPNHRRVDDDHHIEFSSGDYTYNVGPKDEEVRISQHPSTTDRAIATTLHPKSTKLIEKMAARKFYKTSPRRGFQ